MDHIASSLEFVALKCGGAVAYGFRHARGVIVLPYPTHPNLHIL